jgi:predicted ArsR family transcriptional regulator
MDVSDDMQLQAKALADPSRFRLFRHITDAAKPVGVAELTELLGFNHNAIRQHLAVLTESGLVAETTERRTTRGRPRKEYTARDDALSAFRSVSGSYERLASLLLEVIAGGGEPYAVGHDAALRARADEPQSETTADAIHLLIQQLASDGFEPEQTAETETTLRHCPFADVASDGPAVVCELHRGLISGFLAGQRDGLTGDLSPRDPHSAGCLITIGRQGNAETADR